MFHSPKTSKRETSATFASIKLQFEDASASLDVILREDPTTLKDTGCLKSLVADAKALYHTYAEQSCRLFDKCISIASINEAQEIRQSRAEKRREVKEFIDLINVMLSKHDVDILSNIDSRSVISDRDRNDDFLEESEAVTSVDQITDKRKTAKASIHIEPVPCLESEPIYSHATTTVSYSTAERFETGSSQTQYFGTSKFSTENVQSRSTFNNTEVTYLNTGCLNANAVAPPPICATPYTNLHTTPIYTSSYPTTFSCHGQENRRLYSHNYEDITSNTYANSHSRAHQERQAHFTQGRHRAAVPEIPSAIDPASLHLIKQELFKRSDSPFDGDPFKYASWLAILKNRMKHIPLEAIDVITILCANTTGAPNKMIQGYLNSGAAVPDITLDNIWKVLHKQYGSPTKVSHSLHRKLQSFPSIRPPNLKTKLQDFVQLCRMIESNMNYNLDLQVYNYASGQQQVWSKLPEWLQKKWRKFGHMYSIENFGRVPYFTAFLEFVEYNVDEICNPNFEFQQNEPRESKSFLTGKSLNENAQVRCIFHDRPGHTLVNCRSFSKLPYDDKRKFAFDNKICCKCLGDHLVTDCKSDVKCTKCQRNHLSLMHCDNFRITFNGALKNKESKPALPETNNANCKCSFMCGNKNVPVSCSKTLLCEISHKRNPKKTLKIYVIIDEQSNTSFIDSSVIEQLQLSGNKQHYTLTTMNGVKTKHDGLVIDGLQIRGIREKNSFPLPNLYTCDFIPGSVNEVATPSIVKSLPHVAHLAKYFPDVDTKTEVLLLLGRDCGNLMKTICYGEHAPFVHETPLGFALVGSPCTQVRSAVDASTLRTFHEQITCVLQFPDHPICEKEIFQEFEDDDSLALSKNERKFMDIAESSVHVNEKGNITLRLPFKNESINLPNNMNAVYQRTKSTLKKLLSDKEKLNQCVEAMSKNIAKGHIEPVPDSELVPTQGRAWWLPVFVVTQSTKQKHRIVFDSSACYQGVSLNSQLLQGPDENNRLRGVLMRFRKGTIAFGGDIEAMFYNFHLPDEDKNYLRFFWYKNNEPGYQLTQFRGCVHLFGNKSSPAIARFGLTFTTRHPDALESPKAVECIHSNIYVDDMLASTNDARDAIETLDGVRTILKRYNIRMCKIISNSNEVLEHYPEQDKASLKYEVDIGDQLVHRTLGLTWHVKDDKFLLKVNLPSRPLTRKGLLSVTNSIYDPLVIANPIVLQGKIIQRKVLQEQGTSVVDWDAPLSSLHANEWNCYVESLSELKDLALPRSYAPNTFGNVDKYELHTFVDASEVAIGAVTYLRLTDLDNNTNVSYIISSSKLIPKSSNSMPRSELCAALLGAKLHKEVFNEIKYPISNQCLYSDSKVVLSYLNSDDKQFSKYVTNRVCSILKLTDVSMWHYINSVSNPADIACRPQTVNALRASVWIQGPQFLWENQSPDCGIYASCDLPEVIPDKRVLKTAVPEKLVLEQLLERVSTLDKAVKITQHVISFTRKMVDSARRKLGFSLAPRNLHVDRCDAETSLIHAAQSSSYAHVLHNLTNNKDTRDCKISRLDPFLDTNGIIRVGGRLSDSSLQFNVKHPVLLSDKHPLSRLVVRHFHQATKHQGRHLTSGEVRNAGYFIEHASKLVRKIIGSCAFCIKLRGRPEEQKMSPLPTSRIEETPPFYNSGVDAFGPFTISNSKTTRQTNATKKVWGLLFTCMASRAVHVEILHGMDISNLTNAIRRFISIRGTCRNLFSDRGTNFIGSSNQSDSIISEKDLDSLTRECVWHFNPPYASHFGGTWERKIGAIRRVLESSMLSLKGRALSIDELSTLFCEASAIVNNTPMWELSADPKDPLPISPAMLITMKDSPNPPPVDSYTETDIGAYGRKRWRRVQFLAECFWQKWRTFYLAGLQERSKWKFRSRNVREGDVVLLRSKNEPRNSWPLAIIDSVKYSSDGIVRTVTVKTIDKNSKKRSLVRPISEIIMMIPNNNVAE